MNAKRTLDLCRDAFTLTVVDFQEKHAQPHPLTRTGSVMLLSQIEAALGDVSDEEWIAVTDVRLPEPDPEQDGDMSRQLLLYVPEWEGAGLPDPVTTGHYFFRSHRFRAVGGLNAVVSHWRPKPAGPGKRV